MEKRGSGEVKSHYREVTVAKIREQQGDHVEVIFLESARFYRLLKKHPKYEVILETLRKALASGTKVRVRSTSPDGETIENVF